jgi:hypothetical protein
MAEVIFSGRREFFSLAEILYLMLSQLSLVSRIDS